MKASLLFVMLALAAAAQLRSPPDVAEAEIRK